MPRLEAPVHVIDPDCRRRAGLSCEFNARSMHAEIYEDLREFSDRSPDQGLIFAAEDALADCGPLAIDPLAQLDLTALPVIVYAPDPSPERIVSAMLGGALDYLKWPFDHFVLDATFRRLAADGDRWTVQRRTGLAARSRVATLSSREREVLQHLVRGSSNKQMACALQISARTVEIHRRNMMRKLGASSVADAVRVALYAGIDED